MTLLRCITRHQSPRFFVITQLFEKRPFVVWGFDSPPLFLPIAESLKMERNNDLKVFLLLTFSCLAFFLGIFLQSSICDNLLSPCGVGWDTSFLTHCPTSFTHTECTPELTIHTMNELSGRCINTLSLTSMWKETKKIQVNTYKQLWQEK